MFAIACAFVLGSMLIWPGADAHAQVNVPSTGDPTLVPKRFEEPKLPKSQHDGIRVPKTDPGTAPAGAEGIKFTLRGITVEGATVYQQADFLPIYEKHLGKDVPLTLIYEIARRITQKYAADGYILSQAVVPPQEIDGNGIIRIRVIEGFVDKVMIEGEDLSEAERAMLGKLGAKVAAERPLSVKTLERYLLLAEDLPGASVRGVLKPSTATQGAADLVFVTDHDPIAGYVNVGNRGTKFIGPWQIIAGADINSPFGRYEHINATFVTIPDTSELRYVSLSYDHPIGAEGTRVSLSGSYTDSEPGASLIASRVEGETKSLSLNVSHPFIRSRRENLNAGVTLDYANSRTTSFDAAIAEDRIRALRVSGSYDFVDTLITPAVTLVSAEVSQGFDILAARDEQAAHLSREDGRTDFTKITADLTRIQRLPKSFSLALTAKGQIAFQRLLSSEEFSVGGSSFGGAYDSAEITGDNGIAAKAELRWSNKPGLKFLKDYQVYAYYDFGKTFDRDPQGSEDDNRSLSSVGIGVRGNFNDDFSYGIEVAKPLARVVGAEDTTPKNPRVFVSLTGRF